MIPARRTYEHNVTATGTVQGDAYQLTTELVDLAGGAANTGVLLSDGNLIGGGVHFIHNRSGSDKKIYPQSGQSINGLASDTPITLGHLTGLVCTCTGAGTWFCSTGTMPTTGSVIAAYAAISAESNATTTTFSGTSSDWSQKSQVTIFDTNGTSFQATPDHTNDHITIDLAGVYRIDICSSMSGGANDTISFAAFKNNGATKLGTRATRKLGAGGDVGAASVSMIESLSANDTIEMWAQNEDDTDAVTFQDVCLMVSKVN